MNAVNAQDSDALMIFSPMFDDFIEETRDEENHWYDTDHVPQRLTIPGWLSAARLERSTVTPAGAAVAPLRYLHAYRISDLSAVTGSAYETSFRHMTPRTSLYTFEHAIPVFRDTWRLNADAAGRGRLTSVDGARTMLVIATEPGTTIEAAREFIADTEIPIMLGCPGVVRVFPFERVDAEVALATEDHAPRFLTAYILGSPEAVVRPDYVQIAAALARANDEAGNPISEQWRGVYEKRASPWTIRPED